MADELTKKAADMLLQGAVLVSDPCPYCNGVRVIKDGDALCVSCGRAPEKREPVPKQGKSTALQTLEKKMEALAGELESEADHAKQQEICRSLSALAEVVSRLKSHQQDF